MITLLIDAHENRDVATADIVEAYLLATMEDYVKVKVDEALTDIMCQVNPESTEFVSMEICKKLLYLQLTKASYGCMQSALLWYHKFKECLEKLEFKLNPYNPCATNRDINSK